MGKNNINKNKQNMISQDEFELKTRFFALYFFQDVLRLSKYTSSPIPINSTFIYMGYEEEAFLLLKDINKITDEEAYEIQKLNGANHLVFKPLEYSCLKKIDAIEVIDYLRSKGYVVPFMNYSVEDLIEKGWVKLI